jgi:hypothetical protein
LELYAFSFAFDLLDDAELTARRFGFSGTPVKILTVDSDITENSTTIEFIT